MGNNVAKTREFFLLWDSTMANPNGDMLTDNRPRQDEKTGQLEVSPVRIKRYVKDDWKANGFNVFTTTEEDEEGAVLSCEAMVNKVGNLNNIPIVKGKKGEKQRDKEALNNILCSEFIDVKLFGCVVTKPNIKKTGTLQVAWTKSINEGEIKFIRGNSAFASGDDKGGTTFSDHYICPYALFTTYMVFNSMMAIAQGITVTDKDIEDFRVSLIRGMKTYKSHSKNQMPRMLVEVVYKETSIDGELAYVDVVANNDLNIDDIRSIKDVTVSLDRLKVYVETNKDIIEAVNVYTHDSVTLKDTYEGIFTLKQLR